MSECNTVSKPRIDYIDLAKGFCILFVVLWHSMQFCKADDFALNHAMMSFRMPLYFVLSGLFFKEYGGLTDFIRRKTNKLLIPFFAFYAITCVMLPMLIGIFSGGYSLHDFVASCYGFILERFSNGAIWFLLCLFNCNVIFYIIMLFASRRRYFLPKIIIYSCLIGLLGYFLGMQEIKLFLYIDSAMTCMPFFCFGYILRKYTNILYPNRYDSYTIPICVILGIVIYLLTLDFGIVEYKKNIIGENILVTYLCGVIGSLFILILSKLVKRVVFLNFVGRYSIMILLVHYVIIRYISPVVLDRVNDNNIACIIVFIVTVTACSILIPFFRKYMPYVTAQKDFLQS